MNNGDLIIDDEFRQLIPPPAEADRQHLEEQLRKEGCLQPLVVWKETGILLDGHTRKEICDREVIEYAVVYRSFASRDDAKMWVIYNQLARRNLTDAQRIAVARKLEPLIKARAHERQAATSTNAARDSQGRMQPASLNSSEPVDTRATIARIAGVSPDTVSKMKKIDELAPPELKEQVLAGEVSINRAHAQVKGDRPALPSSKTFNEVFLHAHRHLGQCMKALGELKDMTRNKPAYDRCQKLYYAFADGIAAWEAEDPYKYVGTRQAA